MLTKFIQTSYQKWILEHPTNLNIDDFVNFASTEYNMNPTDVLIVLNGQRGGLTSNDMSKQLNTIIESNIEPALQSHYQNWLKAPVGHTHIGFINSCVDEFKLDYKIISDILTKSSWYKLV